MLPLLLPTDRPLRVLAIGAHCDDIEIGAAGLVRRLSTEVDDVETTFCVLTSTPERADESRAALEALWCADGPDSHPGRERRQAPLIRIEDLRDSRLPAAFDRVKDILGELAADRPDLVLVHSGSDAHQDHRLLGELAPTAFRNTVVLAYEVPKWDGDLGRTGANLYVPLTEEQVAAKWRLLDEHYPSQRGHDWFTEETVRSLARLRGIECRAAYAEAFHAGKVILGWTSGTVTRSDRPTDRTVTTTDRTVTTTEGH